jgi:hypothetical protein
LDRCFLCKSQAYFYGYQQRPIGTRWVVCYDCRGARTASGSPNVYMYRTDDGHTGYTSKEPSKGLFRTGKDIEVAFND